MRRRHPAQKLPLQGAQVTSLEPPCRTLRDFFGVLLLQPGSHAGAPGQGSQSKHSHQDQGSLEFGVHHQPIPTAV